MGEGTATKPPQCNVLVPWIQEQLVARLARPLPQPLLHDLLRGAVPCVLARVRCHRQCSLQHTGQQQPHLPSRAFWMISFASRSACCRAPISSIALVSTLARAPRAWCSAIMASELTSPPCDIESSSSLDRLGAPQAPDLLEPVCILCCHALSGTFCCRWPRCHRCCNWWCS